MNTISPNYNSERVVFRAKRPWIDQVGACPEWIRRSLGRTLYPRIYGLPAAHWLRLGFR